MAKKKKNGRSRPGRKTKDELYFAVNVFMHVDLLDILDGEAKREDRSRRAQLERILCRAFDIDHATLPKAPAKTKAS